MSQPKLPAVPLWVPVGLAMVAGFVEALSFDKLFGTFPANQSGNTILAGVALGERSWTDLWPPLVSIALFSIGVLAAVRIGRVIHKERMIPVLLIIEATLLTVFGVLLLLGVSSVVPDRSPPGLAMLGLIAFTMGIQTYAVHLTGKIQVATTYQSGAIVRMADTLAEPDSRAPRKSTRVVAVLSTVLIGYIAGAAIGASLGGPGRDLVLCLVPIVIFIAAFEARRTAAFPTRAHR